MSRVKGGKDRRLTMEQYIDVRDVLVANKERLSQGTWTTSAVQDLVSKKLKFTPSVDTIRRAAKHAGVTWKRTHASTSGHSMGLKNFQRIQRCEVALRAVVEVVLSSTADDHHRKLLRDVRELLDSQETDEPSSNGVE